MRRKGFALVLSLLASFALLAGASVIPSSAAPASYPPKPGPALSVNTTTPVAGEAITISGSGWRAGIRITIQIHSEVVTLASVTTRPSGTFDATVKIPSNLRGHHTLTASSPSGTFLSLAVVVVAAAASSTTPGSGTTSGGLPFTGADIYALVGIGLLFLLIGATLVLTNRRRRTFAA